MATASHQVFATGFEGLIQIDDSTRSATTGGWLLTFLGLAYQPLSDADLDAYIAFSETPAGQVLNRAQFAAFDALFAEVSHRLGVAAAGHLAGEDL